MRGLGKLALPARFVLIEGFEICKLATGPARIKGCEKRKPATGPARIKGFEICEPATGPARMKNCERFHCFINSKRAEWAARDMGIHQARPHQRLGETQVPHRTRPDERLREHPIRTPAAIAGSIPTKEGGMPPRPNYDTETRKFAATANAGNCVLREETNFPGNGKIALLCRGVDLRREGEDRACSPTCSKPQALTAGFR